MTLATAATPSTAEEVPHGHSALAVWESITIVSEPPLQKPVQASSATSVVSPLWVAVVVRAVDYTPLPLHYKVITVGLSDLLGHSAEFYGGVHQPIQASEKF